MAVEMIDLLYGLTYIIVTIAIWSYSFTGVSLAYEYAESSAVGLTVGLSIYTALVSINTVAVTPLIAKAQYLLIVPIILGILGFMRIFPRYLVLARPAIALTWGISAGLILYLEPYSFLKTWSSYAIRSLSEPATWILYLILVTSFSYFIWNRRMSMHESRTLGIIPRIGRLFMFYLAGETMTALIFKRVTFIVAMANEIRGFLTSWGIPV